MRRFACVALFAAALGWAATASAQTVDEVLKNMAAKAETIKDLNVSAKVIKYDSVFEKKDELRLELWYKKPELTRVDTFKKQPTGAETQTQLVIIGKDYVLRCKPETHTGEITRIDAAKMKEARENRNDPMTFFERKPEELKKDFDVQMLPSTKPNTVKLVLKPKKADAMEFKAVELVIDKTTWLPTSVRTMEGGEDDNWALYEFTKVLINTSFPDVVFANPPGYVITDAPVKK